MTSKRFQHLRAGASRFSTLELEENEAVVEGLQYL
jgi:hypothetical protein